MSGERFSFLQIHPISYPRGICESGTFPHVVSRLERVLPELGPFDLRLNDLDPLTVAAFSRVDEELTEGRHDEVPREVGALLLGLGLVVLALLLQRLHEHLAILEEHVVDGHEGPEVCPLLAMRIEPCHGAHENHPHDTPESHAIH